MRNTRDYLEGHYARPVCLLVVVSYKYDITSDLGERAGVFLHSAMILPVASYVANGSPASPTSLNYSLI